MSTEGEGEPAGSSAEIEFTWDPAKAAANLGKHKVAFAQAAMVFGDALALTVFDEAHSDFEERWFTLGMDSAASCWRCRIRTRPPGRRRHG